MTHAKAVMSVRTPDPTRKIERSGFDHGLVADSEKSQYSMTNGRRGQ
jgi:hypothetical protein